MVEDFLDTGLLSLDSLRRMDGDKAWLHNLQARRAKTKQKHSHAV